MIQRKFAVLLTAGLFLSIGTREILADGPKSTSPLFLDDDNDEKTPATGPLAESHPDQPTRYFFDLLDHRSSYGNDFFHDPFLGPEFDAERQVQVDYLHTEGPGGGDEVDGGFQWNVIGELTVAGEFGWSAEKQFGVHTGVTTTGSDRRSSSGLDAVDLAAYHPIFQFVTDDKFLDYTLAGRLDVGIPTRTPASGTDAVLTPYLGQLLRLGSHLSVEAWTGAQFTLGPRQTNYFIYGISCGYNLPRDWFPVPFTESWTPIVEIDGRTAFNGPGRDNLFGVAGTDAGFRSFGSIEPHFELGYQFPIDRGARNQLRWGIVAELFVQF